MAKLVTPVIGLAVVVALAMVAVFGAMSLAPSPAAAQAPPVSSVVVTVVGDTADDKVADATIGGIANEAAFKADVNLGFTVAFNSDTAFGEGDEITIKMPGFGTPGEDSRGTDVRLSLTGTSDDPSPSTLLLGNTNDVSWGDGEVTVVVNDFANYQNGALVARFITEADGVLVSFAKGAGITTPADLRTDAEGDTGKNVLWSVQDVPGAGATGGVAVVGEYSPPPVTGTGKFMPDSDEPGDGTRYDIEFTIPSNTGVTDSGNYTVNNNMNTLTDEVVIKLSDFDLPSNIGVNSVAITVDKEDDLITETTGSAPDEVGNEESERTTIAEDVSVSGSKIFITIGDLLKDRTGQSEDADHLITGGSTVSIVLRQSAGISNPTEYGDYGPVITVEQTSSDRKIVDLDWEAENSAGDPMNPDLVLDVPRIIEVDPEDGGLGDTVTATGKGYKNGTTLTIFIDSPSMHVDEDSNSRTPANNDDGDPETTDPFMIPNGKLDLGEDVLCVVSRVSSDDTGSCDFDVTHPTFGGGVNYISAVDGRSGYPGKGGQNVSAVVEWEENDDGDPVVKHDYLAEFVLEASVSASPAGGSPGEIMLVQVVDFPPGQITKVEISREAVCSASCGNVDGQGSGNFSLTIPNSVKGGVQELRISGEEDANGDTVRASTNVTFVGPQIKVTPGAVLANQRVSLIGTGFSPGAVIANEADGHPDAVTPEVSIGGKMIDGTRINDSDPVRVDNGGNWSASVDLPLAEATTAEGERAIRVSDSRGRTGVVLVDIPARGVTVTPDTGRVGTIAVVRGSGFPSKNDEGSSFNVEIVYDASNGNTTTVSATPDASGRFETQLRIPTTAAIPSSNSVKVSFRDTDQVVVVTTVAHEVPEGIVTLSETSGGPGSSVTVNGEGFKSFVPVSLVKVGTLDVTPSPKPSTDGNGMMSFDVTIPGLDVGIQTIEVSVGRTTASVGFTVTESGVNPGDIKEVAPSLEDLGDNFVNIWNFNNDTKAWSFYDGQEGSDLTHMISGETYLIQIKSTVEVILNGDTRNLTCVGAATAGTR